jgi:hypothetical protein
MKALIIGAALALPNGASALLAPAAAPKPAVDAPMVQKTLEAKILRQRLRELGLSDREIGTRMKRLSDEQIHQLASRT